MSRRAVNISLSFPQALALQDLVGLAQVACEGEPDMTRLYRTPPAERASDILDAAIAIARPHPTKESGR